MVGLLLLKLFGLLIFNKLTPCDASMPPPLKQVYTCPPTFVMLQQPTDHVFGNPGFKCYNFLQNQLPYQDAGLECAKLNASLATPRGKDETLVISEYVIRNLSLSSRHYWINVASNLTKESISPTAPSSGILGKIKESITRSATTPSSSSTNQQPTCRNMLVWVVGKGDTRWIDEVCNKKAYPLCEVEAKLEVDDGFPVENPIPSGTGQPSEDSLDTSAPSPIEPTSDQLVRRECSLQCSSHTMRIACELRLFPEAVNQTVVLFDPKCIARENRTHLIIHTALDDCGTLAQNSDQSKVVYKNALRILGSGDNDMISSTEIMKISCRYPQNNFITKGVGPSKNEMQPAVDEQATNSSTLQSESTISDGSSFRHIFLIYKNSEYDCPIQPYEYPYTFHVDDRLYTEIRVIVPSEQIELHAVQCFVTQKQHFISQVRYYLLKNGCAEDKGFKIESSPSLKIVRMSFDLEFIFTIFTEMYIHCEMMICAVNSPNSAKCQYECSKTKKRQVIDNPAEVEGHSLIHVTSPKIIISNTTRRYTPDETKVPYIPEIREDDEMTSSRMDVTSASVVTSSTELMTTTSEEATRIKKITGSIQTDDLNQDGEKKDPKSEGLQELPKSPSKPEVDSQASSSGRDDARGTATTSSGKPTSAAGMLIIVSLHYLSEGWN